MISFNCPQCARVFTVNDDLAGRMTKCPACGQRLQVPSVISVDLAPSLPPPAPFSSFFSLFKPKNEPWYYGYCYKMTLILLGLSLFGVFCGWFSSTSLLTIAKFMPTPKPSQPRYFDPDAQTPYPAQSNQSSDPGFAWLFGILLTSFWAILSVLWMLYFAGLVLIFIDAARWIRRYCNHSLHT